MEITQENLLSLFHYNSEEGRLYWKANPNKATAWNAKWADKPAGAKDGKSIVVSIDNKSYRHHRLVFLYHKGYLPVQVDHKDRTRHDTNPFCDKIENLRDATHSQNNANKDIGKANTSGYKNVYKTPQGWRVIVKKDKKPIEGGTFLSLKEAVDVANDLRFDLFGEFALYQPYKE
ncbi:hypothetical protein falkor_95 [Salmonella phage falkor]|uniref:HNH nuclease domain-containing protein n=2 Tax=Caudoviricetes TaxID=2731619 RepID=A0A6G8RKP9_9CAUD|nr:hypothetical protein falkor_95 [Salmonella phage falkor]